MRRTQEEVDAAVEARLRHAPATITALIEEMVTGPSETQVRRAAWKLLYDESRADVDRDLRIVVKLPCRNCKRPRSEHCSCHGACPKQCPPEDTSDRVYRTWEPEV